MPVAATARSSGRPAFRGRRSGAPLRRLPSLRARSRAQEGGADAGGARLRREGGRRAAADVRPVRPGAGGGLWSGQSETRAVASGPLGPGPGGRVPRPGLQRDRAGAVHRISRGHPGDAGMRRRRPSRGGVRPAGLRRIRSRLPGEPASDPGDRPGRGLGGGRAVRGAEPVGTARRSVVRQVSKDVSDGGGRGERAPDSVRGRSQTKRGRVEGRVFAAEHQHDGFRVHRIVHVLCQ
mmetsp:Transcript_39618/g.92688  ORF Transcript_39618/g.92688 Transcript_39618/m.92688 type:complete len:236 (-) Transcript_39618:197-904(-)